VTTPGESEPNMSRQAVTTGRPAVFLDRDGTIVREADYLSSISQLRLLPGAAAALRRLNEAGFAVVIVTNQSGIARGMFTEIDFQNIQNELLRRLARHGARIDATYYCPHHPEAKLPDYGRTCDCRKPAAGMLLQAAQDLGLDLSRSYAIGDSGRDVEAGKRAGCRTILVRTGYGKKLTKEAVAALAPDHIAADLAGAAEWILSGRRSG
jgi:D-glycero-D-manno-heptose 1,7-bisphosphate phosphatase